MAKREYSGAVWFDISFFGKNGKDAEKRIKKAHNIITKALAKEGFDVGEKLYTMDFFEDGNVLWHAE